MKISIVCFVMILLLGDLAPGQEREFYFKVPDDVFQNNESVSQRSERLIEKGKETLIEAEKAKDRMIKLSEARDISPVRKRQLQERVHRLELKAGTYFEDAHRIQYRALRKKLKNEKPAVFQDINSEAREQFQRAAVLRGRAVSAVPGRSPLYLIEQAAEDEISVIEKLLSQIQPGENEGLAEKAGEEPEIAELHSGKIESSESGDSLKLPKVEPKDEISAVQPESEIFFSIQFLAVRNAPDSGDVKAVYNGSLPVIANESEGWYRFSAGKFSTFKEAVDEMNKRGIYGFIVAFRGKERIDTVKARHLTEKD